MITFLGYSYRSDNMIKFQSKQRKQRWLYFCFWLEEGVMTEPEQPFWGHEGTLDIEGMDRRIAGLILTAHLWILKSDRSMSNLFIQGNLGVLCSNRSSSK